MANPTPDGNAMRQVVSILHKMANVKGNTPTEMAKVPVFLKDIAATVTELYEGAPDAADAVMEILHMMIDGGGITSLADVDPQLKTLSSTFLGMRNDAIPPRASTKASQLAQEQPVAEAVAPSPARGRGRKASDTEAAAAAQAAVHETAPVLAPSREAGKTPAAALPMPATVAAEAVDQAPKSRGRKKAEEVVGQSSATQARRVLPPPTTPAVPLKESVKGDYIVCLEDGKRMKMLKRHLATEFNLTPDEYRARWKLPPDYPMVAPNYARQKSFYAKSAGLGTSKMRQEVAERRRQDQEVEA